MISISSVHFVHFYTNDSLISFHSSVKSAWVANLLWEERLLKNIFKDFISWLFFF